MARETQEQRLARCRDRIDASRRWRENQGYVATWRRMIDLYRGQLAGDRDEDGKLCDEAMVNLSFSVLNVVVAAVTTQYPKFTVSPNQMGQDPQATIAEAVLNYAWRHYNFHDEFQAAVVDMCMMGHGWLKVGWRYAEETETRTLTTEEQTSQALEARAQAEQMAGALPPDQAGQLPTDEQIAEAVPTSAPMTTVTDDDPFVERVSPFDIVIDPESCMMRELRWIAQRSVRDLEEVRDDPAYDARARHKVQADMSVGSQDDAYGDRPSDTSSMEATNDEDRVTIWEYYDLQEGEWCVFAQDGEGFLVKPTKIPTPFDNPFVMFRDHDVPETFYPIGEIESIETLQEELNKTRTQEINARKQFVRKFIAREATMNPRAREALGSEIDGDVAVMTDDDRPLTDMIIAAPSLTFDPQVFIMHSQQIVTDLQMVSGLSDYQFGQMPDTRRLATEAMAVEGATNARASYKLSRVERTLANVGRLLLEVMQAFMESERVARVAGPGGEMLFSFTPEDITGEFDLIVEAGSTQPKNDMIRRQEAVTLFNTLAPFMGTLINPQELIRYLLAQGYDIKNVDRFFMPPPPPVPPGAEGMMPGAPGPEAMGAGPGGPAPPGPVPALGPAPVGNGQPPIPVGV